MADEIGRLIEQLARWPGWHGCSSTQSTLSWIADFQSRRRQDEFGPSMPVLGGEASDTQEALRRVDPVLSECLIAYYAWPGTLDKKLGLLNRRRQASERISRATFYRHVDAAHPAFWEAYTAVRSAARRVGEANALSSGSASAAVARRYRLVAPAIGVVRSPENRGETPEASGSCTVSLK